jgi:hypothetical protein
VDRFGLSTTEERVAAVQKWEFPQTLKDLETFIGICNYQRDHIPYYARIVQGLERLKTDLLKHAPKQGPARRAYSNKCAITNSEVENLREARASFEALKQMLAGPNTLIHFNPASPLIIRLDASKQRGFGTSIMQVPEEIMVENQISAEDIVDGKYDSHLEQPVCYLSKRLNKHEVNYWPTELEVAALVWSVQKARAMVDDADKVVVYTDHNATIGIAAQTNFKSSTPHKQNLRLVRASLYLSQFGLTLRHVPGKQNVIPDALSRLLALDSAEEVKAVEEEPDLYEELFHMEPLTSVIHVSDELVDKLQKAYLDDPYIRPKFSELRRRFAHAKTLPVEYINFRLVDASTTSKPVFSAAETLDAKFLLYIVEGERTRLVIPKGLHQAFLQLAHDRNNHAGIDRTYQRLRTNYFIKSMAKVVKDYVSHCPSCLINKPPKFAPTGKLQPIRPAANPWDLVTMDFIVKLPAAKMKRGKWQSAVFDSVLTITDKLTRYIWLVPGREDWSAKEWAEAYFAEVYPTMGIPGAIITDRGSVFVSYMWTTLFSLLGTDCMATTAYNPEADGQSERTNQTVEIALRHLVNDRQDDWIDFLGEIQLASNNSINASTKMAPNEALRAYLPRMAVDAVAPTNAVVPNSQRGRDLNDMKAAIITKREEARDALAFAEFAMAAQYDAKHHAMDITVGDRVFINFAKKDREGYKATGVNAPKLGPQRAGPFRVLEMAGENACLVEVPPDWKIWPVISFRNLTKAPDSTDLYDRKTPENIRLSEPDHEPEIVLDVRHLRGIKQYLVKWVGLPITRVTWENADRMENWKPLIDEFEAGQQRKAGAKRKRSSGNAGKVVEKKSKTN